jgi:hypothetical protein
MTLEAAMLAHLLGASAVTALVGQRISPPPAPQNQAVPFVTYQRISRVTPLTFTGETGPSRHRLQVDCWATSYLAATALADTVEQALHNFRGAVSGRVVYLTRFADRDSVDFEAAPVNLHRVSRDFFSTAMDAAEVA